MENLRSRQCVSFHQIQSASTEMEMLWKIRLEISTCGLCFCFDNPPNWTFIVTLTIETKPVQARDVFDINESRNSIKLPFACKLDCRNWFSFQISLRDIKERRTRVGKKNGDRNEVKQNTCRKMRKENEKKVYEETLKAKRTDFQ